MTDTWEERMGQKKVQRQREDDERRYRINEREFPREKAEQARLAYCPECSEVRQEFGRWIVFMTCRGFIECPHSHHQDDGPGMAL